MRVQLERLAAERRPHGGDQRPRPLRGEDPGRVLDVGPVDVRAVRVGGRDAGVERVVVHGRDRVGQRPDDLARRRPSWRSPRWPAPRPCRGSGRARRTGPSRCHQRRVDERDDLGVRPLPGDEPEPGADELQRRVRHCGRGSAAAAPTGPPGASAPTRPSRSMTSSRAPGTRPGRAAARSWRCARCAARSPPTATGSRPAATRRRADLSHRGRPDSERPRLSRPGPVAILTAPARASAPRYPVSTPPAANSGSASSARCSSRFVVTPSMRTVQGLAQARERPVAVGAVRDDLGQQRVVVGRHGRPGLQCVSTRRPAMAGRPRTRRHRARARPEGVGGVLGVQPAPRSRGRRTRCPPGRAAAAAPSAIRAARRRGPAR